MLLRLNNGIKKILGKTIFLGLIAIVVIVGVAYPIYIISDESKAVQQPSPIDVLSDNPSYNKIKEALVFVATNTGINHNKFISLADCESGLKDICVIDTNNKLSCGIFMFQKDTFNHYCPDLKWHNSIKEDIICAARMIKDGLMSIHWVNCSLKIL